MVKKSPINPIALFVVIIIVGAGIILVSPGTLLAGQFTGSASGEGSCGCPLILFAGSTNECAGANEAICSTKTCGPGLLVLPGIGFAPKPSAPCAWVGGEVETKACKQCPPTKTKGGKTYVLTKQCPATIPDDQDCGKKNCQYKEDLDDSGTIGPEDAEGSALALDCKRLKEKSGSPTASASEVSTSDVTPSLESLSFQGATPETEATATCFCPCGEGGALAGYDCPSDATQFTCGNNYCICDGESDDKMCTWGNPNPPKPPKVVCSLCPECTDCTYTEQYFEIPCFNTPYVCGYCAYINQQDMTDHPSDPSQWEGHVYSCDPPLITGGDPGTSQ